MGTSEGQLSHDFNRGTWVSLEGNFSWGVPTLNGIQNLATKQTRPRIGATAAWRVFKHQSVKVSYSDGIGTYVRFGDYQTLQVAWQYSGLVGRNGAGPCFAQRTAYSSRLHAGTAMNELANRDGV